MDAIPCRYALPPALQLVAKARLGPQQTRTAVVTDTGASPPFDVVSSAAMTRDFFRNSVLTIDYPGRSLWLDAARR